jgi:hypothetical protein
MACSSPAIFCVLGVVVAKTLPALAMSAAVVMNIKVKAGPDFIVIIHLVWGAIVRAPRNRV